MLDLTWLFGQARITYTHHPQPLNLTTKSGSKTPLPAVIQSSIPPCRLNPLLFNGHLQTMWTATHNAGPPIYYKRRMFQSRHSVYPGQFAVDFVIGKEDGTAAAAGRRKEDDQELPERTTYFGEEEWESYRSEDTRPMLVCLHGLTGGSHEVYLRETLAPLLASGEWAACVVNGRGCALSRITTPQLFNSRSTWDVRQTIAFLRTIFPNRTLYAVGFSLGANILTNYVAEEGDRCVLKAAVACSNPWNLELCDRGLKNSWLGMPVYSRVMAKNMLGLFERHKEQILQNEAIDEKEVYKCRYLFEFDQVIQAPTWGYPTWGAYYRDAQSADAVLAVKIPFLGINAEDDPISHKGAIPYQEFKANPYTVLCTTNWGGHLSWFQLGGKRWFATAIAAFLSRMHDDVDTEASVPERLEANGKTPTKKNPVWDPCHRRLDVPLQ